MGARAQLGEGTIWDPVAGVLWWTDIYGPTIYRFDPVKGESHSWPAPEYLGCIGLRAAGGLVVTMASGFHFFDPASGAFTAIADPDSDLPDTRFNDGKPDRFGHFWSGSMFEAPDKTPQKIASLYRLGSDGTVKKMLDGIGCSNGLAFSPDGRVLYFTDSLTHLVWAFDHAPEAGVITNRRVFVDLTERGYIVDGSTVDASGNYWLTVPFKGKGVVAMLDVADRAGIQTGVASLLDRFGQIDILVNNAGIGVRAEDRANIEEFPEAAWDEVLAIDLTGLFLVSRAVIKGM